QQRGDNVQLRWRWLAGEERVGRNNDRVRLRCARPTGGGVHDGGQHAGAVHGLLSDGGSIVEHAAGVGRPHGSPEAARLPAVRAGYTVGIGDRSTALGYGLAVASGNTSNADPLFPEN